MTKTIDYGKVDARLEENETIAAGGRKYAVNIARLRWEHEEVLTDLDGYIYNPYVEDGRDPEDE